MLMSMKKTIEYLIIGSLILTLITGATFRLLDINQTVQIMLFLLSAALLIIFINLKVILVLQKYGLDFYLRYGDLKMHYYYRLFVLSVPIVLALPFGLISYILAFFIYLFIVLLLGVIIPAGVRLMYGDGEGRTEEVISIVSGILCFFVFLAIELIRRY